MTLLANVYAAIATIPVIPFIVIYLVVYYFIDKDSKEAVGWALNITTVFLISANIVLINQFGVPAKGWGLFLVILLFAILTGGLAYLQLLKRGEVQWKRLTKAVWRLGFLSLVLMYVVLFIVHLGVTLLS